MHKKNKETSYSETTFKSAVYLAYKEGFQDRAWITGSSSEAYEESELECMNKMWGESITKEKVCNG